MTRILPARLWSLHMGPWLMRRLGRPGRASRGGGLHRRGPHVLTLRGSGRAVEGLLAVQTLEAELLLVDSADKYCPFLVAGLPSLLGEAEGGGLQRLEGRSRGQGSSWLSGLLFGW